MGLLKRIKKAVAKALGTDNKPKAPTPDATLGPTGDMAARRAGRASRTAMRRPSRGARGRDSTIITAGSETGTRTLLG